MDQSVQIDHIRQCVLTTLSDLGIPDADWSLVIGRRLPRDRACAVRSYPVKGIRAVWMADENLIEFYAEDGRLLKNVEVGKELPENQKAA